MTYLLIRVHSITCDYAGCHEEEEHAEPTKRDAMKVLYDYGWRQADGKHYCYKHAPEVGALGKLT